MRIPNLPSQNWEAQRKPADKTMRFSCPDVQVDILTKFVKTFSSIEHKVSVGRLKIDVYFKLLVCKELKGGSCGFVST